MDGEPETPPSGQVMLFLAQLGPRDQTSLLITSSEDVQSSWRMFSQTSSVSLSVTVSHRRVTYRPSGTLFFMEIIQSSHIDQLHEDPQQTSFSLSNGSPSSREPNVSKLTPYCYPRLFIHRHVPASCSCLSGHNSLLPKFWHFWVWVHLNDSAAAEPDLLSTHSRFSQDTDLSWMKHLHLFTPEFKSCSCNPRSLYKPCLPR